VASSFQFFRWAMTRSMLARYEAMTWLQSRAESVVPAAASINDTPQDNQPATNPSIDSDRLNYAEILRLTRPGALVARQDHARCIGDARQSYARVVASVVKIAEARETVPCA
jgi:hypothetical protein